MPIPVLIQSAAYVQVAPPLALVLRRNFSAPVLWLIAATLVSTLGNIGGRIAARALGNNHWLAYIDLALMYTCFLVALLLWQSSEFERLAFRIAIFLLLILDLLLVAFVEDMTSFSRFSSPMFSLALLGLSAWTLLRRALRPGGRSLLRSDWFWIAGGMALYGATIGTVEPIAGALLVADRIDLLTLVYQVRAVFVDISFVAITVGVLCPAAPEFT